jgi:hypothetical protein
MDRIFLRLALPHFRRYQEQVLSCTPLSPLCFTDFCSENCERDPLQFVPRGLARRSVAGCVRCRRVLACPNMPAWAWDIEGPCVFSQRVVQAEHQL